MANTHHIMDYCPLNDTHIWSLDRFWRIKVNGVTYVGHVIHCDYCFVEQKHLGLDI